MNIVYAFILGIVEGITEFLPISSTAHLIITSKLLNIPVTEFQKFFEVFIQSGAIIAIVILYWKKILKNKDLSKKILVSFFPTALVGFILYKFIKDTLFQSYSVMLLVFFLVGLIFILLEFLIKKKFIVLSKKIEALSYQEAILIGLVQSLAIVPGVSRAGAVLVIMMLLRYKREDSVIYSFLLAVPTIFAASIYDLYKSRNLFIGQSSDIIYLFVGSVVSAIVAYIVVRWFLKYISKNSLIVFGIYRVLLVIIMLVITLLKL